MPGNAFLLCRPASVPAPPVFRSHVQRRIAGLPAECLSGGIGSFSLGGRCRDCGNVDAQRLVARQKSMRPSVAPDDADAGRRGTGRGSFVSNSGSRSMELCKFVRPPAKGRPSGRLTGVAVIGGRVPGGAGLGACARRQRSSRRASHRLHTSSTQACAALSGRHELPARTRPRRDVRSGIAEASRAWRAACAAKRSRRHEAGRPAAVACSSRTPHVRRPLALAPHAKRPYAIGPIFDGLCSFAPA